MCTTEFLDRYVTPRVRADPGSLRSRDGGWNRGGRGRRWWRARSSSCRSCVGDGPKPEPSATTAPAVPIETFVETPRFNGSPLQGVRMGPRRNGSASRTLRATRQTGSTQEGRLALIPAEGMEANSQVSTEAAASAWQAGTGRRGCRANKSDVVAHGRKHIFKVFANCLPIGRTTLLSASKQSSRNPQLGDFREAWAGAGDGNRTHVTSLEG